MTAKRFIKGYHTIRDTYENKTYDFRVDIICGLLNELDGNWIDEFSLRETLQLDLQRVEEENKTLKTRFKEERELAMRLSRECDTLTIKKQELELEIIRLETIIRTGDVE